MVRQKIPGQLCAQLPQIIDEQLNSKLLAIPQSVPLTDLLQLAISTFGLGSILGDHASGGGAHGVKTVCVLGLAFDIKFRF